jgi:hypothetical protein
MLWQSISATYSFTNSACSEHFASCMQMHRGGSTASRLPTKFSRECNLHHAGTLRECSLHDAGTLRGCNLHDAGTLLECNLHGAGTLRECNLHHAGTLRECNIHHAGTLRACNLHYAATLRACNLHYAATLRACNLHYAATLRWNVPWVASCNIRSSPKLCAASRCKGSRDRYPALKGALSRCISSQILIVGGCMGVSLENLNQMSPTWIHTRPMSFTVSFP